MHRAFILSLALFFVVLSFPILALDETVFIATAKEIRLPQGELYLQSPSAILEDELFFIELLFYPDVPEGIFSLYRENSPLLPTISGSEVGEEQIYFYLKWADTLRRNASYALVYVIDEQTILQQEIVVQVNPKPVLTITTEEFMILESLTQPALLEETRFLFAQKNIKSFTPLEITTYEQTASKATTTTKSRVLQTTTYEDGTTRDETIINIIITPHEPLATLYVIEHIPKLLAPTTRQLTSSRPFIVLEEDPVILWQLENVNEPVTLSYAVEKTSDITGNTILLATVPDTTSIINWKLLAPLLLIPFIALIVFFGTRFTTKHSSKKK